VTYVESQIKGFGVTLVLGTRGTGELGTLPAGVSKALADVKEFLPYKTYRVLDTLWMAGETNNLILRGLGDEKYALGMRPIAQSATRSRVDLLRLSVATEAKLKAAEEARRFIPPLIDTSFNIQVGETVVVGTSRLDGDDALILLVTAVAK